MEQIVCNANKMNKKRSKKIKSHKSSIQANSQIKIELTDLLSQNDKLFFFNEQNEIK